MFPNTPQQNNRDNRYTSSKEYKNPYFNKERRGGFSFGIKIKLIFLSVIAFIALCLWGIFFSPLFMVKNIEINIGSNETIHLTQDGIRDFIYKQFDSKSFLFFSQKNIIVFSQKDLRNNLNKIYTLEKFEVIKKLPNKLVVNSSEKRYAVIWEEGGRFFYLDPRANVLLDSDELGDKKGYPLIKNRLGTTFNVDQKINTINNVVHLSKLFIEKGDDILVDFYSVNDDASLLIAKISSGPEIKFSLENDLRGQLDKMFILKNSKLKENFYTKEYIDLRFGDAIYYK